MTLDLTPEETADLHALLMQAPNGSGTYPVLMKLVQAANAQKSSKEEVNSQTEAA